MGEKQLYGYFMRQTGKIADKTWTWLQKGNLKRVTEFLLIAAQGPIMLKQKSIISIE